MEDLENVWSGIICQSATIDRFVGPSDIEDVDDPYNYKW